MPKVSQTSWPHVGLERHIEYASNFFHLNKALGGEQACADYFHRWRNRYLKVMKTWTALDTAIWCVRMRRSLKEAYTATYFALSAQHARRERLDETYYYLSYYAVFHGMWAVLLLHPEHRTEFVAQISHDKLGNIFSAEFCRGPTPIMSYDMRELVPALRFLREYYSYNMPMNHPDAEHLPFGVASTGGIVKHCLQLANLHSHIVQNASQAAERFSTKVTPDLTTEFIGAYRLLSTRRLPKGGLLPLEPSDSNNFHELLERGCELYAHSIMQEHFDDEFMNYGDPDVQSPIVAETRSKVWHAFF